MLTVDLISHMDAGDRKKWKDDQNVRPLSELGCRQAAAIVDTLVAEPVDGLYAGRALRCRQTLEPLAERLGMEVTTLPELSEDVAWRVPDGWTSDLTEAAYAAGSVASAMAKLEALHPGGRVVACSHGHVIPAYVAYLAASRGLRVSEIVRRGYWWRLTFDAGDVSVDLREVPGFPNPS